MTDTSTKLKLSTWLWVLATIVMLVAAVYQRRTGPTYPLRGQFEAGGELQKFRLPRSSENTFDARVTIPDPGQTARLLWRRYPTNDPFTVVFMAPELDGEKKILVANIPSQPVAGKVEYQIEIANSSLPTDGETVILRYKGHVSTILLISHVLIIFSGMLVSTRAGLGAVFRMEEKKLPMVAISLIFVGGLVLGAFVQKAAFGAYWTGWPLGTDLTDNKTLFMFGGWLVACSLALFTKFRHLPVVLASVLTLIVYIIPHSLRGSQLDYQQESIQVER